MVEYGGSVMAGDIDWMIVKGWGQKQIGAAGFIDNKISVFTAFYEDADANKDGHVGKIEWATSLLMPVSNNGGNLVQVAMQARADFDILARDQDVDTMAKNMYYNFAKGLGKQGVYAAFFSVGVGQIAEGIAGRLANQIVVQFAIRKGMEYAVKQAYLRSVGM
jgi:hypothetical protein